MYDYYLISNELSHYNPNHDPKSGKFTSKSGGGFIRKTYRTAKNLHSEYEAKRNERIINSGDAKYVYENRRHLSTQELNEAIRRIETENKVKELSKSPARKFVERGLETYSDELIRASSKQLAKEVFPGGQQQPNKGNPPQQQPNKQPPNPPQQQTNKEGKPPQTDRGNEGDKYKDTKERKKAIEAIDNIDKSVEASNVSTGRTGRYVDLGESYIDPHNQRYVVSDRRKHNKKRKTNTVVPFNTVIIE